MKLMKIIIEETDKDISMQVLWAKKDKFLDLLTDLKVLVKNNIDNE